MNSSKLSTLSLLVAAFMIGVLAADDASAARGGGRSGGGRSGHGHGHHHRVFVGASAGFFVGSWYYPGYWPGYYPGYAYLQPPPVTYYIERGDQDAPGDAWFFCPAANAYFPTVIECPTEWQRIPAQP